jgi:hypothetical protein
VIIKDCWASVFRGPWCCRAAGAAESSSAEGAPAVAESVGCSVQRGTTTATHLPPPTQQFHHHHCTPQSRRTPCLVLSSTYREGKRCLPVVERTMEGEGRQETERRDRWAREWQERRGVREKVKERQEIGKR